MDDLVQPAARLLRAAPQLAPVQRDQENRNNNTVVLMQPVETIETSAIFNPYLLCQQRELCQLLEKDRSKLEVIAGQLGDLNGNIDLNKNLSGYCVLQTWNLKGCQDLKKWEDLFKLLKRLDMHTAARKLQELYEKNCLAKKLTDLTACLTLEKIYPHLIEYGILERLDAEELKNEQKTPTKRLEYLIEMVLIKGPFNKLKEFHKLLHDHFSNTHTDILKQITLCTDGFTD